MGKVIKYEATKKYKDVKKSLLSRLDENGTTDEYYINLVDDYMKNWIIEKLLYSDIRKRGVNIEYLDSKGQQNTKKNDSVGERVKVLAQMTQILSSLGIKPGGQKKDYDDEM